MSNDNIKVERKEYHRVTATFKFLFPKEDVLKEFGTLEQFEKEIEEGIRLKSKKGSVIREINESLNWFKKLFKIKTSYPIIIFIFILII